MLNIRVIIIKINSEYFSKNHSSGKKIKSRRKGTIVKRRTVSGCKEYSSYTLLKDQILNMCPHESYGYLHGHSDLVPEVRGKYGKYVQLVK